jgi:hypothetical protein
VLYHINHVVFGQPAAVQAPTTRLPNISRIALVLAIVPVVVLGVWIPQPLHELLQVAGSTIGGTLP